MNSLTWRCRAFSELEPTTLYALLRLRAEVFIVEQDCAYQDLDGNDVSALHVLGYLDDKLVAYARLLPPGAKYEHVSIGRVVTSKCIRRDGIGKILMRESIQYCDENWPGHAITISAQHYLERFYQGFGFRTVSAPYAEDGIPHIRMQLEQEGTSDC